MKLYAIYIGGDLDGANIELHDMRFVTASSIEETYESLLREWWGKPNTLHIDCWAELSEVDGYNVELMAEVFEGPEKLYYINLGGYDPTQFSEQHRNVFLVASSLSEAKRRAIDEVKGWQMPHRDEMYDVDRILVLNDIGASQRVHLHLTRNDQIKPLNFVCRYTPIRCKTI